jgi:ankyrin repeat protein
MKARLVNKNINDLFVPKSKEDVINAINNLNQKEKDTKLIHAAQTGQLDIVKLLIEYGANIHRSDDAALRFASFEGHINIVKYLIEKGADVQALNNVALFWASYNNHKEVVNLLKKHGANYK